MTPVPFEELRAGDFVLSRRQDHPEGAVTEKMVEEVFVRTGRILHLHVGGQVIRTTAEHPFFVDGIGKVVAALRTWAAGVAWKWMLACGLINCTLALVLEERLRFHVRESFRP